MSKIIRVWSDSVMIVILLEEYSIESIISVCSFIVCVRKIRRRMDKSERIKNIFSAFMLVGLEFDYVFIF